jgi:hypothetical protein
VTVNLPDTYLVNNAFNLEDVRPWLQHDSQLVDCDLPPVQADYLHNTVVSIVDRRKFPGRMPEGTPFLDLPCEYLVLRRDNTTQWYPSSSSILQSPEARKAILDFEWRYQRDATRPCGGVSAYPEVQVDYDSPDEYPFALRKELESRYNE